MKRVSSVFTHLKRYGAIPVLFALIVAISCIVAPMLKKLFMFAAQRFPEIAPYVEFELAEILSRLIMVLVVVALVITVTYRERTAARTSPLPGREPFWKRTGVVLRNYGLGGEKGWKTHLTAGFVVGVISLIVYIVITILIGGRVFYTWKFTWYKLLRKGLKSLFSVAAIGCVEEFIFRGVVLQGFMKKLSRFWSVIGASLVFAAVHFFGPVDDLVFSEYNLLSGFRVVGSFLQPLADPFKIMPVFIGLFLVGVVLATAYLKTGRLYFSIGLHAGWVYIIQLDVLLVTSPYEAWRWLIGGSGIMDGCLSWLWLYFLFYIVKYITAQPWIRKGCGVRDP